MPRPWSQEFCTTRCRSFKVTRTLFVDGSSMDARRWANWGCFHGRFVVCCSRNKPIPRTQREDTQPVASRQGGNIAHLQGSNYASSQGSNCAPLQKAIIFARSQKALHFAPLQVQRLALPQSHLVRWFLGNPAVVVMVCRSARCPLCGLAQSFWHANNDSKIERITTLPLKYLSPKTRTMIAA